MPLDTDTLIGYLHDCSYLMGKRKIKFDRKKTDLILKEEMATLTHHRIIDYTTDFFFLEGLKQGEEKGIQIGEQKGIQIGEQRGKSEGIQIGEQRGKMEAMALVVQTMHDDSHLSIPEIARLLKLSPEEVNTYLEIANKHKR